MYSSVLLSVKCLPSAVDTHTETIVVIPLYNTTSTHVQSVKQGMNYVAVNV